MAYDRDRENSFGGFQYRWNYDEYQKSLQRKRKKSAARGMRAFCLTTIFVFLLCTASLLVVLTASLLRGKLLSLPSAQHDTATDISMPMQDSDSAETLPAVPETPDVPMLQTPYISDVPQEITNPSAPSEDTTAPREESAVQTAPSNAPAGDNSKLQGVALEDAVPNETTDMFAEMTISEIAETCSSSTVTIQCRNTEFRSIGSGFILSEDGYIVTNHHVIERYEAYQVLLQDGTTYNAELVFALPERDLVLLKIEAEGLPTVTVGSSSDAAIGDQVVAIGTPGSVNFAGTVTYGYISGLDRNIERSDNKDSTIDYLNMIQITAAINPGNSGGPLFNRFGEVIAINTMKLTGDGFEGMGFAIPIDAVYPTLTEQIDAHRSENTPITEDTETVSGQEPVECDSAAGEIQTEPPETEEVLVNERPHAVLGIQGETVTEKESLLYKMPVGVIIRYMEPGSYAEQNGLQIGDIILSMDGTAITDAATLHTWEQNVRVGDTAQITVFRAGAEVTLTVTFGEPAPQTVPEAEAAPEESLPLSDAA